MNTDDRTEVPPRRRKRSTGARGVPANVVFFTILLLNLIGVTTALILPDRFPFISVVSVVLSTIVVIFNDRTGFIYSREARRAFEARRHFTPLEVIVLILMIMMNVFVIVYAWMV